MIWNGMNISGIDMDATGKKISKLIDESGLSDKELGGIMGLSVQSINKWRHGHNLPDIENLFLLSRILGIKVDDFLVPLVVKSQPEVKVQFVVVIQPMAEGFSASTIRRLWAYYIRLREMYFNYSLSDSPT
jgi:transcriptional regulator with XRE-family HTH domain